MTTLRRTALLGCVSLLAASAARAQAPTSPTAPPPAVAPAAPPAAAPPAAAPPAAEPAPVSPLSPTMAPENNAAPPLVLSQRTEQQPVPRSEPFYDTLWFWGAVGVVVATVAVILVWNLSSNGDPPPDTTFGNMHAF